MIAALAATTAALSVFAGGVVFSSIARANESVITCGPYANHVFQHAAAFGISTGGTCPNPPYSGGGLEVWSNGNDIPAGSRADWQATAPSGLAIVGASVPNGSLVSTGVDDGEGYGGGFYWAGGGAGTYDGEPSIGVGPFFSNYFGFQLVCGVSTCTTGLSHLLVGEITLYVQETTGPTLVSPDGVWQSSGWVRGDWTLHLYGDSPSGLCGLGASISGQSVASSSSSQDPSVWHQCSAPGISQTIHTWQYGEGSMPLTLSALDAAGVPVSYTKTIYVDNSQPSVAMSGPTDAPSTAGVQYVTATGGGSPSGIDGLSCSVDGAPAQWYPGASAEVPVSGVGAHSVRCSAANNAVDQAGNHGWSDPASWSVKIGEPTVSGISFGNVVDALRCARVKERVTVPARWVTVRHGHKLVKVRRPAHTKLVKVMRCHPRTTLRRVTVWVTVRRQGRKVRVKRTELERVVLTPHVVNSTSRRVPYGHGTTVNGWLGTDAGIALGGQTVSVLTAPDNGLGQFTAATTVTTVANGSWSASLPPGPSRLVEAVYGGSPTTEPSSSPDVLMAVPAKLRVKIKPARVSWGKRVVISGQILGGYIPANQREVSQLLRLRIGVVGIGISQTAGIPDVNRAGQFRTSFCFNTGRGVVHYWFSVSTLVETDYPFQPASSRRLQVKVGPHNARHPCG